MIGDINWSVMLEGGGQITGTTSFDIDDVCWSRIFKPDSGGGGSDDDGGSKPFDQMTWDQVIASTKTGKYKSFNVGDMKELDLGSEGIVHMQIVGIDADELADGSGYAPLTFISKDLLATKHRMNPINSGNTEGTGTIGGWEKCEMRAYLKETVKLLIPENVRNAIVNVTKYSRIFNTSGTAMNDVATTDDVWIPSRHEMFDGTTQYYETKGPRYSEVFLSNDSRKKSKVGETNTVDWWLRSANTVDSFNFVNTSGINRNTNTDYYASIALGFCL